MILGSIVACSAVKAGIAAQTSGLDCGTPVGEIEEMSETDESSLMQSDISVMPSVNERFSNSYEMTDEFDAYLLAEDADSFKVPLVSKVSQVSLPDHFSDARFYIMTLTYALCFAILAELRKRWQSWGIEASDHEEEENKLPINTDRLVTGENQSDAKPDVNAVPIFDLGGSADFDTLAEVVRSEDASRCLQIVKMCNVARKEDACGCTALHIAAQCGSSAMAKILIEHGAAVDARSAWNETPLHIAAREGSAEVCQLLLEHGAEINAVDESGQTPLFAAALAGNEVACEMLFDRDASVHGKADSELPPLLHSLLFRRMFTGATSK